MPIERKKKKVILLQLFCILLICLSSAACYAGSVLEDLELDFVENDAPNDRVKRQTESNSVNSINMDHKYYTVELYNGLQSVFWVDIGDVAAHDLLSDGYRLAARTDLSFNFPFYGDSLDSVTIVSGGFLYMSPFLHQHLTSTQYIAPLMAGFDTKLGERSDIYYRDFGTKFVVEWRDVRLHGQNSTEGFTFQTIIYQNGTIVFDYETVPIKPMYIDSSYHPVKAGISDAFYIDTTVNGKTSRKIYEYDKISVNFSFVQNDAVVLLHPKPTCNSAKDCEDCVTTALNCSWCETVKRCSDGIDRYRQEWLEQGCVTSSVTGNCSVLFNTTSLTTTNSTATTQSISESTETTKTTTGSTETIKKATGSAETTETTIGATETTTTLTETTETTKNNSSTLSNTFVDDGISLSSNQKPMYCVTLFIFALTLGYITLSDYG